MHEILLCSFLLDSSWTVKHAICSSLHEKRDIPPLHSRRPLPPQPPGHPFHSKLGWAQPHSFSQRCSSPQPAGAGAYELLSHTRAPPAPRPSPAWSGKFSPLLAHPDLLPLSPSPSPSLSPLASLTPFLSLTHSPLPLLLTHSLTPLSLSFSVPPFPTHPPQLAGGPVIICPLHTTVQPALRCPPLALI